MKETRAPVFEALDIVPKAQSITERYSVNGVYHQSLEGVQFKGHGIITFQGFRPFKRGKGGAWKVQRTNGI